MLALERMMNKRNVIDDLKIKLILEARKSSEKAKACEKNWQKKQKEKEKASRKSQ